MFAFHVPNEAPKAPQANGHPCQPRPVRLQKAVFGTFSAVFNNKTPSVHLPRHCRTQSNQQPRMDMRVRGCSRDTV